MLLEEGIKLLLDRSQVSRDDRSVKEATAIVTRLGFHALAIDQAGSYISKRHLDVGSYLTHFKNRREKVLSEHPHIWDYRRSLQEDSNKETELTVFTTWELSFQLISGNELERKDKEHILTLIAFFNINGLSDQLFVPYARKEKDWMISCRNNGDWDTYAFHDILTELRNLSLLQSLEIQESAFFALHPLIQDWIQLRISPEKRKLFSVESVIVLGDSIKSQDLNTTSFQVKQLLQSHLDAVLSNKDEYIPTEDSLASRELLIAAFEFATFLCQQGWFKRAEEIGRTVVEGLMKLFGDAGLETFAAKNELSYYLFKQGKYAEAEPLCRESLAMQVKVLGKENVDTLQSMSALTEFLKEQGKYQEAEGQCRDTLALQENVLGKEAHATLKSMDVLAGILRDQTRYSEAERISREVLAISKKVLGKEHRDTLTSMNNLALALEQQDKLGEAEPIYRESLALTQTTLGKEHPLTFASMNNLAVLLERQGKLDDAERLYRKTLMLREVVLGKEHPETLNTMHLLAVLLCDRDNFGEAEDVFRRAHTGFESMLGSNHPETLYFLSHFAGFLCDAKKYKEAESLFRDICPRHESVLGPNHSETLTCLLHFRICLDKVGKDEEADEVWQQYYDREKENEEEAARISARTASREGSDGGVGRPRFICILTL
jgi:tetratricopeptide (TPR) repeat protein